MVKSQSAVEHYLLKTCARGWIFVLVAIQNDSLSVFMQVCLFKICKCHLLPRFSTSALTGATVYVLLLVQQHCHNTVWVCYDVSYGDILSHTSSAKIILAGCSQFFFQAAFYFFLTFFFYSSRKILASVRYSMSITGKSNKSVRLRL